jgi:glycosyltransferase involved in cell wall biosynthesis
VEYLANQYRNYDSLVFFSLHPAMIQGCTLAPDRTVVFPYLQPGPALRLALWRELLESVRGVGFFSDAERRLAHRYVGAAPAKEDVVGVGVEIISPLTYPRHQQDPADDAVNDDIPIVTDQAELAPEYLSRPGIPFRRQHRLYGPLATYVGRVEPDNGFEELFEYFDAYIAANGDAALGLFGVKMMKVPDAPFVRMAGVAPNQQRIAAFEAADVALIPSPDDLLSLPLLESLAVGTPILTSSRNATAVDHCRASNGGLDYANRNEFVECMRLLIGDVTLREGLGENGREYVRHQYNWEAVTERFEHLIGARKRRRH